MSKGGFDVKVKSQGAIPASYYCPHCKKLLKNAVQTSEGDRLCHVCFEEIARMPQHTCKECTLVVNPNECYPDMANRKEISHVVVLCDNEDQGCPWSGKLMKLKDHVDKCQYKKTQCNLCFNYVFLSYLDQHKKEECPEREINCDYCNARVIAKDRKIHFGCCQLFPMKCQHCQATVPRKNLPEHEENECTHVLCVCGEVVKRENRGDHIKEKNQVFDHLKAAQKSGKSREDGPLVREVQAMQESMKTTTSQLVDVQRGVSDIYTRLTQVEEDVRYLKEGSSSLPMGGKDRESSIKELRAELRNVMNLVAALTNRVAQLEEQGRSKNYNYQSPRMGEGSPREMAKSGLSVNDKVKFLEDKILEVEKTANNLSVHDSELELKLQASLASTYTGEFVWRIPDVQRRIREAKSGRVSSIYSPPFYTSKPGYKMCMRCYLNGDGIGEGRHLSLFFVIMKGEYDALLLWPFDYKVSLKLLSQKTARDHVRIVNHNPNSTSFSRPKTDMNVATGCPQFISLDSLDPCNSPFLVNDVLFFKCSIVTNQPAIAGAVDDHNGNFTESCVGPPCSW